MAKKKTVLDVPVTLKGVSINKGTVRIGIGVERDGDGMSLADADKFLCGRRLTGSIVAHRPTKDPDQTVMFEDSSTVTGSFDVKQFSCKPDEFSSSLVFAQAEVKLDEIAFLANKKGQLRVAEVGDMPRDSGGSEDDPEADPA